MLAIDVLYYYYYYYYYYAFWTLYFKSTIDK